MTKRTFLVEGWLEGKSFDLGLPADDIVSVDAHNESEAEALGDAKLFTSIGKCDVVVANVLD